MGVEPKIMGVYPPNHPFDHFGYPYFFKGILAAPPKATPPRNKGLIRPY